MGLALGVPRSRCAQWCRPVTRDRVKSGTTSNSGALLSVCALMPAGSHHRCAVEASDRVQAMGMHMYSWMGSSCR